jgi:hypothetical protein
MEFSKGGIEKGYGIGMENGGNGRVTPYGTNMEYRISTKAE